MRIVHMIGMIATLALLGKPAFALPADGEWEQYGTPLTTVLPTEAELGSELWLQIKGHVAGAMLAEWTSAAFFPERREICIGGGGHADYGGNEFYCWNIDTGAVARVTPILPLTNTTEPGYNASTSPWPASGPPAQHTYDGFVAIDNCRVLYAGTPGFSKTGLMTPGDTAHIGDRCNVAPDGSWTWTRRDDLRPYIRTLTGVYGDSLVIHSSNGVALLDRTTLAIGATATNKGIAMNGVNQGSFPGFNSQHSAGGVSTIGFYVASPVVSATSSWLTVMNLNGGVRDIDGNGMLDDDSFGRFRKIPIGVQAGAHPIAALLNGFHSMATMPDGWLALWGCDRRIIFFRPSPDNLPAGDEWLMYDPATGPTDGTSGHCYDKIFWDDQRAVLVGVSNKDEGLWLFNPPFIADATPANLPPVAGNASFVFDEDTQLVETLAPYGSDPEAGELTFSVAAQPETGTLALLPDGALTYDPVPDANGVVLFQYQVCDAEPLCATGTVTLNITPVDEPPPPPEPNRLVCNPVPLEYEGALPNNFALSFNCVQEAGNTTPPPPPPPPPEGAALDTGPWGPDPDASLASLALRSDTLLADPLDDTLIQGPGVKPTDDCLTLTLASACSAYEWRSNYKKTGGQGVLDTTVKVEGDGSLLCVQESQSGPGDGCKYEVNPSSDGFTGVSVGNWVRLRYKVRYNCDYLYLDCDPQSPTYKTERRKFDVTKGYGGFKMGQLAEVFRPDGNGGSTFIDTQGVHTPVFSNYKQEGFPGAYIWGINRIITTRYMIDGVRYWDIQPGGPDICYSYDNYAGCHFLQADEWMTVQEDLYYGPCTTASVSTLASHLRLWIADEGEPFDLVMDTPIDLICGDLPEPGPKLGRAGLTDFMTGKDPAEVHPTANAWFDNVWISRIENPGQ